MDLYNKKKRLQTAQQSVKDKSILKENILTILHFENDLLAEGLSYSRVLRYHYDLVKLGEFLDKEFNEAGSDDLKEFIRTMDAKDYSDSTKHSFRVTLKRFYKWLFELEDEYPDCVKWVKASFKKSKKKLPKEILSQEEVKRLVSHAHRIRDKALIMSLYESGCRVGEIIGLKLSDLEFGDFGVKITVSGKTGSRKILLVASLPYLSNWVNNHPVGSEWLWISMGTLNHHKRLSPAGVRKIIMSCGERAGVSKRLNPHNFRHSRASHLANKLTEAQMCMYFGWAMGSDMPATYVHLSGRDIDNAILEINGIKERDESKEEFKSVVCARCELVNGVGVDFCSRCRLPLNEKSALEVQEKEKQFLKGITENMVEEMINKKFEELKKKKGLRS